MSKLIRVCIGVLLLFVVFPYSAKVLAQDVKAKEILRIGKGAITLVSMRPDGKMVAIGVGNTISLYDDTAKAVGELDGQSGKITTWAWSKDDTKMVTVTDDGSAVVRDGSTGKVILTLKGHTNRINDVEISEDGKTIITGSEDKTAALWDASSGALLQTLQGFSSGVKSVYLSIDTGDRAYTLDGEQRMWIWDTKSGKLLTKLTKPDGELSFINVSADLKYFVVNDKGSKDNSVTVFDGLTGNPLTSLPGMEGAKNVPTTAFFSRDGSKLAIVRRFAAIVDLYAVPTFKQIATLKGHTDEISTSKFSRDGNYFVTASFDKTARLYNATNGTLINVLTGHSDRAAVLDWSDDGTKLLTSGNDGTLHVWDGTTGKALGVFQGQKLPVDQAYWDKAGTRIFSLSRAEGTAHLWDGKNFKEITNLTGYSTVFDVVRWSPNGKYIAGGGQDGLIHIWNSQDGHEQIVLKGHTKPILGLSWSADSTELASASEDFTAKLWEVESGKLLHDFNVFHDRVFSVALDAAHSRLAIGSRDSKYFLSMWSTTRNQQIGNFKGGNTNTTLRWSPDYTQLAVGQANNYVSVWNAQSDTWQNDNSHTNGILSLAWSSDGTSLATTGSDNKIIVYDPTTLSTTLVIQAKAPPVAVTWSPEDKYIATTEYAFITLFDAATGASAGNIGEHDSYVYSLDWHSDGRLVSSSADGTVRVWQLQ